MADKAEKIAWGLFWVFVVIIIMFIALLGWGFIEFISWLTAK